MARIGTHVVMGLFAAVQGKHQHHPVVVEILHDFIGEQGAVGGQGQFDVLPGFFFPLAHIVHNVLHHGHVHQRFSAEQVQFQVVPLFAAGNGKFDGLPGHFLAHESPMAPEVPGICKAVAAPQVAVVGHMEAQGFQHRFIGKGIRHRKVRRKQQTGLLQFLEFVQGFSHVFRRVFAGKMGFGRFGVSAVVKAQNIINHGVDNVHGAAVHVKDHVIVVQMHSMDQISVRPSY